MNITSIIHFHQGDSQMNQTNSITKPANELHIHISGISRRDTALLCAMLQLWSSKDHCHASIRIARDMPCLRATSGRDTLSIPLSRVMYLTSQGHYVVAAVLPHGKTGRPPAPSMVRLRLPFHSAMEQLCLPRFLPCGRGVILNMDFIRSVDREEFTMQDGTAFPLPSHRKKETAEAYHAYLRLLPDHDH